MAEIRINKVDAARRQIDVAIRLLFSNDDPVAIHTLSAAGFRILRDIVHKNKKGRIQQHFKDIIKLGMEKELWKVVNKAANFFKHADSDADEILEGVQIEKANDAMILLACFCYRDLGYQFTPEMGAFMTWSAALDPKLLENTPLKDLVKTQELNSIRSLSRKNQLEVGKNLLSQVRQDA